MFTLQWLTSSEVDSQTFKSRGEHWLRAFLDKPQQSCNHKTKNDISVSHFFGYKGGQGRSTVLACLSQKLAYDGAKILLVDADIEAPSLDVLFGVKPYDLGSTLIGIVQKSPNIIAMPALQGREGGQVRLIACRPRDSKYDVDFAAFALQTSLMPGILLEAIHRIKDWAKQECFNAILIDHRSGMSMTTLTWLKSLPGPTVVFTKLDEQWRGAEGVIREILQTNPANPGVVVSFKPDDETEDGFRRRTARQRMDILQLLSETIALSTQNEDEIALDPANIEDHWLLWPYDQAFRATILPEQANLGTATRHSLNELTRLLEIQVPVKKKLSGVGSVDQGDLIQTDALMKLRQSNNTFRYIFGRKGTGKTRLATELASAKSGEALLVDAGSTTADGIKTSEYEFSNASDQFSNDPEGLWWAIMLAALQGPTTERNVLRSRLTAILSKSPDVSTLRQKVMNSLPTNGSPHFFA